MNYKHSSEISKTIHESTPDVLSIPIELQIELLSSIIYEDLFIANESLERNYLLYQKGIWKAEISNCDLYGDILEDSTFVHFNIWVKSNISLLYDREPTQHCNIFNITFENIPAALNFVLYEFDKNFVYSKVVDKFIHKNEIIKEEQCFIIKLHFKGNDIENFRCCVCLEPNTISTEECKHNLCRECCIKLTHSDQSHKQCPICRNEFSKLVNIKL